MTTITRTPRFVPMSPTPSPDGHGLPKQPWNGPGRADGSRPRALPHSSSETGVPYDVLGMADEWMGRMADDPAQAPAIMAAYQRHLAQLAPSMQRGLNMVPQATSERGIQRALKGAGPRLAKEAQAAGRAPVFVHAEMRGTANTDAAFRASLREARAAGIQHLVIEQPPCMESIDEAVGGPAVALIRAGQVEQLAGLLAQSQRVSPRTTAALTGCAQNVRDARQAGFEVDFVDPAQGRPMPSNQREKALAAHLAKYSQQGLGVMVSVPALNASGIAGLASQQGAPVATAAYLSGGPNTPESALAFRHYIGMGAPIAPDFKMVRLAHRPFAGPQAGQRHRQGPGGLHEAPVVRRPQGPAAQGPHRPNRAQQMHPRELMQELRQIRQMHQMEPMQPARQARQAPNGPQGAERRDPRAPRGFGG